MRDRLTIKNQEGKSVAEIHPYTGRITVHDDRYRVEIFPVKPPETVMTQMALVDATGKILKSVVYAPNVNTDTVIDEPDVSYDLATWPLLNGVHTKPTEPDESSSFNFAVLPGDDPDSPGATTITRNGKRVAVIDVNGDIFLLDSRLNLRVQETKNPDDPVVFELLYENEIIAEILIGIKGGGTERVRLVDGDTLAPVVRQRADVSQQRSAFADVSASDPLYDTLKDLADKGIIEGYRDQNGRLLFKPDQDINRAEFAKIVLDMLCIDPRDEALRAPPVFYDIPFTQDLVWYFSVAKESFLQGFIKGYLKERDPISGLTPYKPGATINRAEAAKIIIEALTKLEVIDVSGVNFSGNDWYKKVASVAQDLTPYIKDTSKVTGTFLLTAREAADPLRPVTRGEFAEIATRVLKMRNCFALDGDADGLPDEWEKKHNGDISMDPKDDEEEDGLDNAQEYASSTDPFDADTDKGGVVDGDEIRNGTNPIDNPLDDRGRLLERAELAEGIFTVSGCDVTVPVCPCFAWLGEGADITAGDLIVGAIRSSDGANIVATSNIVEY